MVRDRVWAKSDKNRMGHGYHIILKMTKKLNKKVLHDLNASPQIHTYIC